MVYFGTLMFHFIIYLISNTSSVKVTGLRGPEDQLTSFLKLGGVVGG